MIRLGHWLIFYWGSYPGGMPGWKGSTLTLTIRFWKYSFSTDWSFGRVKE